MWRNLIHRTLLLVMLDAIITRENYLTENLAIALSDIYTREANTYFQAEICTYIFVESEFVIALNWKILTYLPVVNS